MEIFLGEISDFLTRFGGLEHSDWSIQWSHDLITRFDETWVLRRLSMWSELKETVKEDFFNSFGHLKETFRQKVSLRTSRETSERNEMCDFTDFVRFRHVLYDTCFDKETLVRKVSLRTSRETFSSRFIRYLFR